MSTIPASFLSGPNAPFIEELYAKYLENPAAVDPSWRKFFSELQDDSALVLQDIRGASWAPRARAVEIGNGHEETYTSSETSAPSVLSRSRPDPFFTFASSAVNFATNSSCTLACT